MFPFKYARTSQPQSAVGIDWGNPVTKGLCFASNPASSEVFSKRFPTILGSGRIAANAYGIAAQSFGGGGINEVTWSGESIKATGDRTFAAYASNVGASNGFETHQTKVTSPSSSIDSLFVGATSFVANIDNNSASAITITETAIPRLYGARRIGNQVSAFVNNTITAGSITGTRTMVSPSIVRVGRDGTLNSIPSQTYLILYWNRALSDAEIASLSANPWQIFAPIPRQLWIGSSTTVISISRPNSDVTTTGWTGNPDNVTLFNNIDESAASDTDYITSPTITGGENIIFGITPTVVAGTWDVRYRANFVGSSAQVRITLQDSGGTSVGVSSWQTVTSTYTLYTASVTTTGTAARVKIEVQ